MEVDIDGLEEGETRPRRHRLRTLRPAPVPRCAPTLPRTQVPPRPAARACRGARRRPVRARDRGGRLAEGLASSRGRPWLGQASGGRGGDQPGGGGRDYRGRRPSRRRRSGRGCLAPRASPHTTARARRSHPSFTFPTTTLCRRKSPPRQTMRDHLLNTRATWTTSATSSSKKMTGNVSSTPPCTAATPETHGGSRPLVAPQRWTATASVSPGGERAASQRNFIPVGGIRGECGSEGYQCL